MTRAILSALLLVPLLAGGTDALIDGWNSSILFLEKRVARDAQDFIAWNLLAERYLRREHWSGDLEDLRRAAHAADRSLQVVPAELNRDGVVMRARVAMAQHRFHDARTAAEIVRRAAPEKSAGWQLLGDAQLELGELEAASKSFDEMARIDGSSTATESRFARLALLRGQRDTARKHWETALEHAERIASAAPDLSVWVRIQLGELAFKSGDWDGAAAHYQAARALAPQHWSVLDHLAELAGARGDDAEALALYERALESAPRAEIWQALGDYHAFMKRTADAQRAYEKALAGFMDSVQRGEVLYYHHLTSLFADGLSDSSKALHWAEKDLALRPTMHAHDALAWALYKKGAFTEADRAMELALRNDPQDAHLLYHAAMIRMSAGKLPEGKRAMEKALALNPRYNGFHTHR